MRTILIVTALYPPAVGGAATYFGDIAPALVRFGGIERVVVLTERMAGSPSHRQREALHVLRRLPARVSGPRRPWVVHAATYTLTQLWFATRLPRLVDEWNVDVIHFHMRYRGRLFHHALRRCGVPTLADMRDKMSDPGPLQRVADRLLCCAEGVQQFAVERGFPAERTVLIPIPFTPPTVPPPTAVDAVRRQHDVHRSPYLLYLGDVTYNKGVYDLLTAYTQWRAKHRERRNVALVLAGLNREGARFREQVDATDGAVYLGHIPHDDAVALIAGAEVVALPSRSEGLPRVVLEALALGSNVICPPNVPEFERHIPEAVLSDVRPATIVDALEAAWQRERPPSYPFEQHDLQRIVAQLHEVYRQLAES